MDRRVAGWWSLPSQGQKWPVENLDWRVLVSCSSIEVLNLKLPGGSLVGNLQVGEKEFNSFLPVFIQGARGLFLNCASIVRRLIILSSEWLTGLDHVKIA